MKITFRENVEIKFLDGTSHLYKKGEIIECVYIFNDSDPIDPEIGFCDLSFPDGRETHSVDKTRVEIEI